MVLQLQHQKGRTPPKDTINRHKLATVQGKASALKPLPQSCLSQERLLEHPQVRILLTISHFGCFGGFLGHHRAPDERCPPLDGAGAGGGLQQRGLSFAHLRVRGVAVEIRLQLRATGEKGKMEVGHFRGCNNAGISTDSSVGVSEEEEFGTQS